LLAPSASPPARARASPRRRDRAERSTGSSGSTGLIATLSACHTDPLTANRYASFASRMTSVPGTHTMAVSFLLAGAQRQGHGVHIGVRPRVRRVVSSQPAVGIFTYDHEVTGLPAPAAFRVLVRARWIDRRHHVIRHEMLLTPVCMQPLLTPDLSIGSPLTRAAGGAPHTLLYTVVVRNEGTPRPGPSRSR